MQINEKDQQIEKCEKSILMNIQNIFLSRPLLLKEYIFLAQIMRTLLSNKSGKSNNLIATKLCANLLNNHLKFKNN